MGSRVALPLFLSPLLVPVVAVQLMFCTFFEPCNLDCGTCLNVDHDLSNHAALMLVVSIYESHLISSSASTFSTVFTFWIKFSKSSCLAGTNFI